jgi:hypothetical protein
MQVISQFIYNFSITADGYTEAKITLFTALVTTGGMAGEKENGR